MKWFNQFKQPKNRVGIEFSPEHISITVNDTQKGIWLSAALELSAKPFEEETTELIRSFIDKHHLKNFPCYAVLPAANYQMLLVERPDVPDSELRDAVKWKLRDLVQTPIELTAIDIFPLPDDARRTGKEMVYAVVADLELINNIIDCIKSTGLELQVIDIEVMALRNLALVKQPERGTAVVRLRAGEADVSIYRAGALYLSRRFQLQYGAGLLDDLPADALALEIQRSFDYFERQMGQSPPTILYLCGEGVSVDKITDDVRRSLSIPIELLEFSDQVSEQAPDENDEGMEQLCIAAIGATYRELVP